ncbi:MAG TPA: hypothetical protein VMH22_10525 [bacterium]|nr:hypothetical protein [bacterium]
MLLVARRSALRYAVVRLAVCFFAFFVVAVPALVVVTHHHDDGKEHGDCPICQFVAAPSVPAVITSFTQPEITCAEETPVLVCESPCLVLDFSPDAPRAPPPF